MGDSWSVVGNKCQNLGGENYLVGGLLGEGGYAKVFAATQVSNGRLVAIKEVKKADVNNWDKANGKVVPIEVGLLCKVSGVEGILGLYQFCEQGNSFVYILERLENSMNLYNYLFGQQKRVIDEQLGRKYFGQIIKMVLGCFDRGVVHRDIKLENILVDLDNIETVKLIDFGCGAKLKEWDHYYEEFKGTAEYAPPEWITGNPYRAGPLTVWSLGVLLYEMLCRELPFKDEESICKAELKFCSELTSSCQDLITACLLKKPGERIKLEEMLTHPWMQRGKRKAEPDVSFARVMKESSKTFDKKRLKRNSKLFLEKSKDESNNQWSRMIDNTDGDWALLIDDVNLTSPTSVEEVEVGFEEDRGNAWVDDFSEELTELLELDTIGVDMSSPDKMSSNTMLMPQKPMLSRKLNTPESMMIDDDSDIDDCFRAVMIGGEDDFQEGGMEY